MNETYEFEYHSNNPKRLNDLAQGGYALRKSLRKNQAKLKPYSRICAELIFKSLPFLLVAALGLLLDELDSPLRVLYYVLLFIGAFLLVVGVFNTINVRAALSNYEKRQEGVDRGLLTFDATGICDSSPDGTVIKRTWEDYDCCLISREVIILIYQSPNLNFLPATPENVSHIGAALRQFGKENTIHLIKE